MRNRRLGELGLESEMMMVFCSEDYPAITSSNEHNVPAMTTLKCYLYFQETKTLSSR